MANIYDTRSVTGDYLRGKTVYGGGASASPNPVGQNQYPKNLAAAARLKRKRRNQQLMTEPTVKGSLLTNRGGNFT